MFAENAMVTCYNRSNLSFAENIFITSITLRIVRGVEGNPENRCFVVKLMRCIWKGNSNAAE